MSGAPSAPEGLTAAIDAIDAWEHTVHARVRLDVERARTTARPDGPLAGLVITVAPRLAALHPVVMAFEIARSLELEHREHADALSDGLRSIIEDGIAIDPARRAGVLDRATVARAEADELFGDRDVLLTLAALGEAPAGLDNTGDPRCARLWTLLGHPTVSVPGLTGATGLPLGVQLVGRHGRDADLLAAAAWLARALPAPLQPQAVAT